ncbi:MAG: DUF2755 family protein [Kluyvera sp.]|uniref:DUF2755 family protein n=1 Tax=Kluyvera sp. TaxID=1538228 RepID=UPI0014135654
MTDFTLSKLMFSKKKGTSSTSGNLAYALFVLLCFSVGAQLLTLVLHAPGVYEHLMQMQDTGRPRVEMGLGVGTLFGVVPFLAGCVILGIVSLMRRLRHHD